MSETRRFSPTRRLRSLVAAALVSAGCADERGTGYVFLADHVEEAQIELDRDRFRPVLESVEPSQIFNLNHETRRGIVAPLPSSIAYELATPPDATLRFAVGVASLDGAEGAPPVRFRVRVDGETLFEETIGRRDVWIDREVVLDPKPAGIRLVLETEWGRAPSPESDFDTRILPLWGSAMISSTASPGDETPLVLISIDCLRADHVGAYGYPRPTTPNIDRFAEDAVVFEEAVSTSSWTLPTHMSMMTGLTPAEHGVYTQDRKLPRDTPVLAELLHRAGYETSAVVTWWFVSQLYGFDRGFDFFRLKEMATADAVIDDVISRLRTGGAHGQFHFVHLLDPHWEYTPPPELLDAFGPRPNDVSRLLEMVAEGTPPSPGDVDEIERLYDGEIAHVDRELGRLFGALREAGLYDDALIVVTADHGEGFYEHASWQHGTLYEEIVRVPLIVKFPGVAPGRVSTPVSTTGIFSTVLEYADVDPPDGAPPSLAEYLPGKGSPASGPIVSEYYVTSSNRHGAWPPPETSLMLTFRRDGLKYIATLGGQSYDEVLLEELFDMSLDPGETENLMSERVDDALRFRELRDDYLDYARRLETGRRAAPVEVDEETKRVMESLGYATR